MRLQPLPGRRDAELFEQLVTGDLDPTRTPGSTRTAEVGDLVGTVAALRAAAPPRQRTGPRPEFVASLRDQLVAEAATRPVRPVRPAAATPAEREADRTARTSAPRVLVVPTGLARALTLGAAAATAGALTLGVASHDALPGEALYGVKDVVDSTQVRLAVSDEARGRLLLEQTDQRLDEVDRQVAAGDPRVDHLGASLGRAADALSQAQRSLVSAYRSTGDTDALVALADYQTVTIGRAERMRDVVPDASVPAVETVLELLRTGQDALRDQASACGAPCLAVVRALSTQAPGGAGAPGTTGTPGAGSGESATASGSSAGGVLPGLPGEGASVPGVPLPSGAVPTAAPQAPGLPSVQLPPLTTSSLPLSTSDSQLPQVPGPAATGAVGGVVGGAGGAVSSVTSSVRQVLPSTSTTVPVQVPGVVTTTVVVPPLP